MPIYMCCVALITTTIKAESIVTWYTTATRHLELHGHITWYTTVTRHLVITTTHILPNHIASNQNIYDPTALIQVTFNALHSTVSFSKSYNSNENNITL